MKNSKTSVLGTTARTSRATPLAATLVATALALPFGAVALLIEALF